MLQELLEQEAFDNGLEIVDFDFSSGIAALIYDNTIGISKKIEDPCQRNTLTAHELGHFHTCDYNLLEVPEPIRKKHEILAERWAVLRVMPVERLLDAYRAGMRTSWDFADYLEIDESFFLNGLYLYMQMHGACHSHGIYDISFLPFSITER